MRLLGFVFLMATAAFGGEFAVLTNGARMHVDRHEIEGARIRLYNDAGYIEMAAKDVRGFEIEEAEPTAPPAAAATPVTAPAPAATRPFPTPRELADRAADKYHLPRELVRSVMAAESGFQTKAVSPKGAIGLMQLMPGTAGDLGVDPHDPAQNVDGAVRYLRDLLIKYDGGLWHALAAYNAGQGAVQKHNGVPPYRETINYVNRIDQAYKKAGDANRQ
jgi:soluble lytic murein transglycosylase-like protein